MSTKTTLRANRPHIDEVPDAHAATSLLEQAQGVWRSRFLDDEDALMKLCGDLDEDDNVTAFAEQLSPYQAQRLETREALEALLASLPDDARRVINAYSDAWVSELTATSDARFLLGVAFGRALAGAK